MTDLDRRAHSQNELLVSDLVQRVLKGEPAEDSRFELKREWIDPQKAARRIAGHVNAAQTPWVAWVLGVDEKKREIFRLESADFADWWSQVSSRFEGGAPDLVDDLVVSVDGGTVRRGKTDMEAPEGRKPKRWS